MRCERRLSRRRSWARQSSGALPIRIPKSGDVWRLRLRVKNVSHGANGDYKNPCPPAFIRGLKTVPRVKHGGGGKGVYGRAIGTVRSKAEPWNERRVKHKRAWHTYLPMPNRSPCLCGAKLEQITVWGVPSKGRLVKIRMTIERY